MAHHGALHRGREHIDMILVLEVDAESITRPDAGLRKNRRVSLARVLDRELDLLRTDLLDCALCLALQLLVSSIGDCRLSRQRQFLSHAQLWEVACALLRLARRRIRVLVDRLTEGVVVASGLNICYIFWAPINLVQAHFILLEGLQFRVTPSLISLVSHGDLHGRGKLRLWCVLFVFVLASLGMGVSRVRLLFDLVERIWASGGEWLLSLSELLRTFERGSGRGPALLRALPNGRWGELGRTDWPRVVLGLLLAARRVRAACYLWWFFLH